MTRKSESTSNRTAMAFWCSALLLIIAATCIEPAIGAAQRYFTKQTINIKKPLPNFDLSAIPSFTASFQARVLHFYDQPIETDEKLTVALTRRTPTRSGMYPEVILHMAYYSDPRHQVAHTPEVCFRQDGGVILDIDTIDVDMPTLKSPTSSIPARYVNIQRNATTRIIDLYTFISNGRFYADRDRLRLALGMPGDRYVYFCKIEVAVPRNDNITDEEAIECAQQALREVIPILVNEYLPTREEVRR